MVQGIGQSSLAYNPEDRKFAELHEGFRKGHPVQLLEKQEVFNYLTCGKG
jgi:hypothetical protein